jgi:hypothetical protein
MFGEGALVVRAGFGLILGFFWDAVDGGFGLFGELDFGVCRVGGCDEHEGGEGGSHVDWCRVMGEGF